MPLEVATETVIERPRDDVVAYVADPDTATAWYRNIESVEWLTDRPLAVGSRLAFVAHFLGGRLDYTYEVVEIEPGRCLVMRTADGPFPMETTYIWEDAGPGTTRMTLINRGDPPRFSGLATPLISAAIRRANRKDLKRLKQILEG